MKFLKKQKPSSIYGTSPQYNTKQKVLGASAGLIIALFIIFSLFGGRSSSPSISTSGSKKSPDTKELKLNQSKHTLGVSNFAISVPEGFNQNKDDDFLKNNSGKVLFRKSASGTQYDFISVNKRSSEAKENTLLTIEKQLKTFATADLKTEVTKLNDNRDVLIAEYSSKSENTQTQNQNFKTESGKLTSYYLDYYLVDMGSLWQISFSSVAKDSLYLKSSIQIVESFKLI